MGRFPWKASDEQERTDRYVQRRRVPVELRLLDGSSLSGEAYLAVRLASGRPESLEDRLNDEAERFLPIAVGDRHLLVKKSSIVVASTSDLDEEALDLESLRSGSYRVDVKLTTGPPAAGILAATPSRRRALDHLNSLSGRFVPLTNDQGVVLVNTEHLVAVSERPFAP